ncbi:RNA-dependent RNA polymerase 2 [Fulvia fulva]|uniref:RNA-dependent RNA polymerase n=1 Tax=Passalora fulva TaxID=5499 RepID=A0A9Q8LBX4_PASFU|nr:RNA-dependent RNA polymerase 2 [Fulvia fulva]UJO14577.1 RNA-dependent RNA polymerase 2 [Fulvia fulva]WPV10616.1 RNA-dependent RNA polymerase 2 [Fulvia fulva]
MARKRKSTEMEPPASGIPNANPRHLKEDLSNLCRRAAIDIPHNEASSPAKSSEDLGTYVFKQYHLLWWKDQAALESAITTFFRTFPVLQVSTRQTRLQLLRDTLQGPVDATKRMCATPRKVLKTTNVPDPTQPYSAPSSPTPATRSIKQHFAITKSAKKTDDKSASSPIKPPPPIVNPVTSFASTAANTSFAKSSFWSNAGSSGTPDTATTSFASDYEPTKRGRESNYLSSMCSTDAAELMAMAQRAESPQNSSSTVRGARTVVDLTSDTPRSPRESQSTWYGSLDPHTVDLALQKLRDAEANCEASAEDTKMQDLDMSDAFSETIPSPEPVRRITPTKQVTLGRSGEQKRIHNEKLAAHRQQETTQPTSHDSSSSADVELVDIRFPCHFRFLPFELQWELQRLLQPSKIAIETLESEWVHHSLASLYEFLIGREIHFTKPEQQTGLKDYEVLTRNARLEWVGARTLPALKITVQIERRDTACSLQRYLGADRVLYVELPDLARPPHHVPGVDIQARFRDWLDKPHEFLGRTWYPFFLQPNKKKSAFEGRASASMNRLIMVCPKDGMSIGDLMEWALPFRTNCQQAARKAFMRLELLLSRTIVAVVLKPSDFAYGVPDQGPTRHKADRTFEDPKLARQFCERYDPKMVMNDGCSGLHPWIAHQYMRKAGLESVPAGLQMRTAGAKGLWYLDDEEYTGYGTKPAGPLIKLSQSQLKVFRDSLEECDDEVLSVCVVNPNSGARPSILHQAFLPILCDRGVPKEAIREVVQTQVQTEVNEFLTALEAPGPMPIRRWLASHNEFFEARTRETGIKNFASGFPESFEERIIAMLENGFDPKSCKYLARQIQVMANSYFDLKKTKFKVVLNKSTTLKGMADPYGCLEPGEVCVIFGSPFTDPSTGESWWYLDKIEVLVCRNPALAPWDIQRVRVVFNPRLARFKNFIIFSSKGMRPLASMLQGGDYDGDAFWFTWDSKLVSPFKNAPAPWTPPPPENFGIRKDKRLLEDLVRDSRSESQWCSFLGSMCCTRMSAKMLGIVTLFYERFIYARGTIDEVAANELVFLHDYLVDADKQGYDYTPADFDAFQKSRNLSSDMPKPAYWEYTRPEDETKVKNPAHYRVNKTKVTNNIIDFVYFQVVDPIVKDGMIRASHILEPAGAYDDDLSKFYKQTIEASTKGSDMLQELLKLKDNLLRVKQEWGAANAAGPFPEAVARTRAVYDSIQPLDPQSVFAVEWLRRQGKGYTTWEKLKASCLARWPEFYGGEKAGSFIFSIAGRELCHLKLNELDEDTRSMLLSQYLVLKPRKMRKAASNADDFDDDAGHDDGLEDVEYY